MTQGTIKEKRSNKRSTDDRTDSVPKRRRIIAPLAAVARIMRPGCKADILASKRSFPILSSISPPVISPMSLVKRAIIARRQPGEPLHFGAAQHDRLSALEFSDRWYRYGL
jgi:hypothetical protein